MDDQIRPTPECHPGSAAAAGAKLIIGDNLYMYGEVDGPIREDLPMPPTLAKAKPAPKPLARRWLPPERQRRLAIGRASDFFGPGVLDSACGDRMFLPAVQGKAAEGWGTWMRLTPTPSSTNSVRVWSSSESATKPSDRPGTFPMPRRSAPAALSS